MFPQKNQISVGNLDINRRYRILAAQEVYNDHGRQVLVELEHATVFLPEHNVYNIKDCEMEMLNTGTIFLVYEGEVDVENKKVFSSRFEDNYRNSFRNKIIRSMRTLNVGERYQILAAKEIHNKYGREVLVELQDAMVFLQKRVIFDINDDEMKMLNSGTMFFVYEGEVDLGNDKRVFSSRFEDSFGKSYKNKPLKSMGALNVGEKYQILSAKQIQNMFGSGVLVELEDTKVFLQKRFVKKMTAFDLEQLNSGAIFLVYEGNKDIGQDKPMFLTRFEYKEL